jgi:flagellar assembly protein FliH
MNAPHKFLFDQSFDAPDPPRASARRPALPPEPTFSRQELEAARAAGIDEGRAAGLAEATRTNETLAAAALSRVAAGVQQLLDGSARQGQETQRLCCDTMRIALQKAVPALARRAALSEIEALLGDCLREAIEEPRLVVRACDDVFEALQRRLAALTAAAGFAGKVVLLADETLGPGDVRVEWAEGGAERDTGRLLRDIDGALARALEAIPVAGHELSRGEPT